LRYYSNLKESTVERYKIDSTVTGTLRGTIIFIGVFLEERGRGFTVPAVGYFSNGIKAIGQEEDFLAEHTECE
jgi:hypothetical protein